MTSPGKKQEPSRRDEMMNASCYLWKWADNDLPGKPGEVHAALLRGQMHPAVQTFDSRPVLAAIEALANGSPAEERDEWNWCAAPTNNLRETHFVFLNCPRSPEFKSMHHLLAGQLLRFDVSCFDESLGMMGDWFPPKLNEFQWGQWPGEMLYEISPDELPVLLKRIQPKFSNPYAILSNRKSNFVQCRAKGRRFLVEWRDNYDLSDFSKFDHWKAQDKDRLAALKAPYTPTGISPEKDPDFLTFADTLNIFRAFLLQLPRPARYHWRNINEELP
jgi:hypothetical protein